MLLDDKVVIVTGAGGGLGAAIARICAREGASVIVSDIDERAACEVSAAIGGSSAAIHCDVRSDASLAALVEFAIARHGRIDGLVNNAGVDFSKPFLETTPEDWERVISTNLRPSFFLIQLVCRQMLRQEPRGGSVVNISSVHSIASMPGAGPYDAAKSGMAGLTRSIAVELAPYGIRVNAISPGLLNTRIWEEIQRAAPDDEACLSYWHSNIPMQRVIEPEEIAEVAAFLLSDRASCMTGANVVADAGMTSLLVSHAPYESKTVAG